MFLRRRRAEPNELVTLQKCIRRHGHHAQLQMAAVVEAPVYSRAPAVSGAAQLLVYNAVCGRPTAFGDAFLAISAIKP